LNDEDE
jgi:hypothetical protein